MPQNVQYRYSLNFSIATILLMWIFMMLIFSNANSAGGIGQMVIYGVCSFIFLLILVLLVLKRLVPALKGDVALALDDESISDYIRDISVNWGDIKQISLIQGRSASIMLNLKWDSDYGKQINIPLRWVKGKDAEIYETVMSYFKRDALSPTD